MIRGIHHISMKCSSLQALTRVREFYCELLGMSVRREWSDGLMFDTGTGLIEVFCNGDGNRTKGAIRHFALAVDDVDGCAERIREAGYEVFEKPKNIEFDSRPPLQARVAFCRGPLGEEIELFHEEVE